jgi:3-hydroxyacyl-CoA dehydrogenase
MRATRQAEARRQAESPALQRRLETFELLTDGLWVWRAESQRPETCLPGTRQTGDDRKVIHQVGVLGAGTMGSRIAAHFANIGIPSLLLDLTAEAARQGIENAAKQRPGAFFVDSSAALITPGSFDADLARLGECDWVIEAVKEDLEIKRSLWRRVADAAAPGAILSTNTSGIPLREIAAGFAAPFQARFLGTHFFNPPRYLHLLELIPGPGTNPELLALVAKFAEARLGKGVVRCKDTPNFIANRIGCFFGATVAKIAFEDGYSVEEVDALTGPLIGLPSSASFRLLDIVGLDVMAAVGENLYRAAPDDPWRERFLTPEVFQQMIERGWLGEKSGQGFYKRVGKEREIHALDWKTFEYRPAAKPAFPAAEAARNIEDLGERLRGLLAGKDRASEFLWKLLSDTFLYSAERVPEISDRIVEIDRAMRWGYAHKLGPFEMWDAIGFDGVCTRLEADGRALPEPAARLRAKGHNSFYLEEGRRYFDLGTGGYQALTPPGLILAHCRTVFRTAGAALVDLGNGCLCVEFRSKLNTLGLDQIEAIEAGLEETEKSFEATVIGNQGDAFSAGANLMLVLLAAQEGDWDELDRIIRRFQQMNLKIKYARKPVVAAPFGRTLGGGCEIALHAHRMQASAETYIGLVELGVGLIPAGGGCKEMLARLGDAERAFERIGKAQVSSSAEDARNLGFLRKLDRVSINPDSLLHDAAKLALDLAAAYAPPRRAEIQVGGEATYALLKLGAWTFHQGGYISDTTSSWGESSRLC